MMRKAAALCVLLTACASGSSTSPNVRIAIDQLSGGSDLYVAGPVNLRFEVMVENGTGGVVTLRRLDLSTQGSGPYALRISNPMNLRVPANSTGNTVVYGWGQSRGGYLNRDEPVTMRGTAVFEDEAGHPFSKIFLQNLSQR